MARSPPRALPAPPPANDAHAAPRRLLCQAAWRLLRPIAPPLWALLTFNLPLLLVWATSLQAPLRRGYRVQRSDAEWRAALGERAYEVLRRRGTEPAGSSELLGETRAGVFACAGCGAALFDSADGAESQGGWPTFTRVRDEGAVELTVQLAYLIGDLSAREARCSRRGRPGRRNAQRDLI